jgi:phosphatidate phosphatase APP1
MPHSSSAAHDETIDRLARAIARYVRAHPNASDTLEGVARWWVASEAEHAPLDFLQRALDTLADQQVLSRRVLPDGRQVYAAQSSADHEIAEERED